jgi:hypothetical protein
LNFQAEKEGEKQKSERIVENANKGLFFSEKVAQK